MSITKEEVEHVATLARLALTPREVAAMAAELGKILSYIDTMRELDVSGIQPTAHAMDLICPLREDAPEESLSRDAAVSQAPAVENGLFKVPKIIDEAGSV